MHQIKPNVQLSLFFTMIAATLSPQVRAENLKVCVEVVFQDTSAEHEPRGSLETQASSTTRPPVTEPGDTREPRRSPKPWAPRKKPATIRWRASRIPGGEFLPIGQTPVVYLERLMEHFVTHQKGYVAVEEDCREHIRVEIYPLAEGWTMFARYTGTGRGERVDQLYPHELSQFAERAVTALLYDAPISATINRDTVLKADSKKSTQKIRGTHHFMIGLGTQVRGGEFDTLDPDTGGTTREIRVLGPMTLGTGYRGKFENWGIEALAQLAIGTSKTAASRNDEGGHIDFGGDFGLALHFLGYLSPRGLTSFYLGAGANFELLWFSAIKEDTLRNGDDRSTLLGGGLDVDLMCGWEFMRASSVQFYLQGELNLPAYVIHNEDSHGSINTWFPGISVKLGMIF